MAERGASRSEPPEAVNTMRRICFLFSPADALEDRAVLAVDGEEFGPGAPGGLHHEAAGHDQGFLVGEGDALALLHRPVSRSEARGAHDGGHHGAGSGTSATRVAP